MEDFNVLMKKQITRGTYITNFKRNTDKRGSQHSAQFIRQRIELLKNYWDDFYKADLELANPPEASIKHSYYEKEAIDVPLDYSIAKAWLEEKLIEVEGIPTTPCSPTVVPMVNSKMHFEKIKLPRFDGKQREWDSFRDKFSALIIQDVSIPTVFKFHHLINSLQGEAAAQVKEFEVVSNKFEDAWRHLCETYDNKFLRFDAHMDAIVQLPVANKETASHLTQLITTALEGISAFKALDLPVDSWDALLIYILRSKLSSETSKEWIKSIDTSPRKKEFPKFEDFKEFIQKRIREASMSAVAAPSVSSLSSKPSGKAKVKNPSTSSIHVSQTSNKSKSKGIRICKFCSKNHSISYCEQFLAVPVAERRSFVKNNKLCFNCLGQSHNAEACPVKYRCLVCGQLHHSRLHQEPTGTTPNTSAAVTIGVTKLMPADNYPVLSNRGILATALVILENSAGQKMSVRALLDSCAEDCIISDNVVTFLQLPKKNEHVVIQGAGGGSSAVATCRTEVTLRSAIADSFSMTIRPLVLKRVSSLIPPTEIPVTEWAHIRGLKLADPFFCKPSRVDCVLGSRVFGQVILPDIKRDDTNIDSPVAVQTRFGWVLMGAASGSISERSHSSVHLSINSRLSSTVERFWEIEEVPHVPKISPEEEQCYSHFKATHYRDLSGRFVVKLPFIKQPSLIGTKGIAFKYLQRLESRLKRDTDLAQHYDSFLDEYETLNHLQPAPENTEGIYLPHHPVWKKDGSKKIRVVFNASQADNHGNSLNSVLHCGPKLQLDIFAVLCRWAFFKHVFTCDIVKMFRQFLIDPSDRHYQRILWRKDPAEPVRHLELNTVTYGTTSAPFLANACLLELADSAPTSFTSAVEIIRNNRYVDDFFGGANTVEEAESIRENLVSLLSTAGLETDKLRMNYGSSQDERFIQLSNSEPFEQDFVSLLGLSWDPVGDMFRYKFLVSPLGKISKRTILSMTARLYDPVGWISPIVLRAKLILQALWLQGFDWDTPITVQLEVAWKQFYESLHDLSSILIPRWVQTEPGNSSELQGFADASQSAYAAVVYIVALKNGQRISTLLTAKSKVAPVKTIQVPRLELCAAHLLTRLIKALLSLFKEQPHSITCWSDSKNVLTWLDSHPSRWHTFIANRVSEIRTTIPDVPWHYIPSGENPADLASRGCSPVDLKESTLWWKGPPWLETDPETWHIQVPSPVDTLEERKNKGTSIVWFFSVANGDFIRWVERFSSADKIISIWAYCLRWFRRINKVEPTPRSTFITAEELQLSRLHIIRHLQEGDLPDELRRLEANGHVSANSPLKGLCPFIDEYGILRVGGRLQHALLTEEAKHPAILSASNHFTEILIRRAHKITLHGGISVVLRFLGQQYWIIRGWNVVRRIVHSCTVCLRHNANCQEQLMAPLPAERVHPSRPFTFTGLDYAGPFMLKKSPGRGSRTYKGYIAVFICLSVKAIHLELVSDLTTSAFIAALRRFISRRGFPRTIFSDNGTNFHGAANELQRLFSVNSALYQEVGYQVAREGISWKFIPPRAPHFGGLWEGNIRSIKRHLVRVLGETKLTYEEFSTTLTQIEACLNSRPLHPISSDGNDPTALTPGHFLIGDALLSIPDSCGSESEQVSCSDCWKLLQQLTAVFWKRWRAEYLCHLQRRAKWLRPHEGLKVGDLVIIKNPPLPPSQWALGRVISLHPGKDGLNRVATVKTASAELVRAVHQLILILTAEGPSTSTTSSLNS